MLMVLLPALAFFRSAPAPVDALPHADAECREAQLGIALFQPPRQRPARDVRPKARRKGERDVAPGSRYPKSSAGMPSPRSTGPPGWRTREDGVEISTRKAQPCRELLNRRHRPDAHDARSTPALAMPSTRPRACSPCLRTASVEARIKAAEPSFTPEAFPAVTVPSARTIGFSWPSVSGVVSARGCSSLSTTIGPPRPPGASTGTISPAKKPSAGLSPPAAGCAGRRRPGRRAIPGNPAATFSPVSGIESMP